MAIVVFYCFLVDEVAHVLLTLDHGGDVLDVQESGVEVVLALATWDVRYSLDLEFKISCFVVNLAFEVPCALFVELKHVLR